MHPEHTDEASALSEYERDRVAWNLPLPRRHLPRSWSKGVTADDDHDDEADDEIASLEPAA
jgi:hypothetical protein